MESIGRIFHNRILIALSLTIYVPLAMADAKVLARDISVCPTCEFPSIKAALDAAPANSRIHVSGGPYTEGPLVISQPVELIGENLPILDGEHLHQILTIQKMDNVVIRGFHFLNGGESYTADVAGLRVVESHNCVVEDNVFTDTTYGVYLEKSVGCHIRKNKFQGAAKDEVRGGNGIHIWTGSDHWIENNQISGHRDGIYLEFVKASHLLENNVRDNLRYGLHFMFSNKTNSQRNQFVNNGSGVAIMYSHDITMKENEFVHNVGTAAYGLLLKEIHSSHMERNIFKDNTIGIYMEGSNRSHFAENQFVSNGYALRVLGDCENNVFEKNNFISNTFDVTTNSSLNSNTFVRNYWSKYEGYDLNHDEIGDVPFRPVSLSSFIIEGFDGSFYLMGSLLFSLLDLVERALPEMTPEPLKDSEPLMQTAFFENALLSLPQQDNSP